MVNGRPADVVVQSSEVPDRDENGNQVKVDQDGKCSHHRKPIDVVFYVRESYEKAIAFDISPHDIIRLAEELKKIMEIKTYDYAID